ncbi:hypothetical protein P3T27_005927 [Kitasatospora sp. MAA19]|uniref:hypothetical protein n=1 Tax=unclassified Kitasatospora TaxID=2633591 RepID=UPI0024733728|nr:hypothetical protein [Kitasatospora sp. MAA19]MDH6709181.1 hypothetical protein [Kitasatospora sp. MAA19]
MTAPAAGSWDLAPGNELIIDGSEWTVETFEPQVGKVVLVPVDGPTWHTSVRELMHHPGRRQSTRTRRDLPAASRGRQPKAMTDLTPEQQLTLLRLAHLHEVETGYLSGDPLLAGPAEPRPQYDPETLLRTDGRARPRETIQPLAQAAVARHPGPYTTLRRQNLSPALARALVRQVHGFHAAGRTEKANVRVASRDCRFGIEHVPPFLPRHWYDEHFAGFADRLDSPTSYTVRHLRRAASLKLAEMAVSTMGKLRPQMAGGGLWEDFEMRVENIARRLDDDQARTDYQRRRLALTDWQVPAGHWAALFDDLSPRFSRMAGQDGQLAATVLVWTEITQAEYAHSPVLTGMRRAGADTTRLIDNITQAYTPVNRTATVRALLRGRLETCAASIAARIDQGRPPH